MDIFILKFSGIRVYIFEWFPNQAGLQLQSQKLKNRIDALEEKLHDFLSTRAINNPIPNPSSGKAANHNSNPSSRDETNRRKGGKIRQH